jgi:hypothetical protein
MTTTIDPTTYSTIDHSSSTHATEPTARVRPLWRTGVAAGVAAAAATMAVAATASAAGASLEVAPGEAIPVSGFGQLTILCSAVGVLMARCIRSRARQPRRTFVRATVALTVLSIVPDVLLSTDTATKVVLVLTHVVAAAIVIPALASRLPEHGTR